MAGDDVMTRVCDLFHDWHVRLEQRSPGFLVTLIDDAARSRMQHLCNDQGAAVTRAGLWFDLITSSDEVRVESLDAARREVSRLLDTLGN
jgi:hypothetical protein